MVTREADAAEVGEFAAGFRVFGVSMPFVDAATLVGVVDEAEFVVDGYGFDLLAAKKITETADMGGSHLACAVVFEAVLTEIAALGSRLGSNDSEDGAVGRAAIEGNAHGFGWFAGFTLKNGSAGG